MPLENEEIESTEDPVMAEEPSREEPDEAEIESKSPEPLVVSDDPEEKPEVPSFTPNFGYRVLKEEKEIPEEFRSLVKDEASEKKVRDLFERADGLEPVKAHRDQLQKEVEGFNKDWVPYIQKTEAALDAARKGDFRSFFEKVGLSDEQIFQYARERLELRKDPARFAAEETSRRDTQRAQELEQSNSQWQSQYLQIAATQRDMELKFTLERPELREVVKAFEERLGAPGAFRSEVIRIAQGYAAQGNDLPVETVVNHVAEQFKKMSGWTPGAKPPIQTATPPVTPGTGRSTTKTIPNISGKATSPAKRVLKTLAEIKAYGKELEASEQK